MTRISLQKIGCILLALIFAGLSTLMGCSKSEPAQSALAVQIIAPAAGDAPRGSISYQAEVANVQGALKEIRWDFGDGQTASELKGEHQYRKGGEFTVTISVKDESGKTAQASVRIKIAEGPAAMATARRAASPNEAGTLYLSDEAPLIVQFSSQTSKPGPGSELASFHWDFGNGDQSDEPNPTYTYNNIGDYQVTLTITDSSDRTGTANVTVRVIAYEPARAVITLGTEQVEYELYSKNARNLNTGPSVFLQYVAHSQRKLTADEIRQVLQEIIDKARLRPRVARISVQLFDKIKSEFMVPRDYAHYLGLMTWDSLELEPAFAANQGYLSGTAPEVLSIGILENLLAPDDPDCGDLCRQFKIGLVDLYLEEENICKDIVDRTFREIVSWRIGAMFDGFLVTIHPWDLTSPIAWAIGTREKGPALGQLPTKFFSNPPSSWNDKSDPHLWIAYTTLPACKP